LACDIKKELDTSGCSFGHLILVLALHYLVKCRSRSLAIYNNEIILDTSCVSSEMLNSKSDKHDWQVGNYCISEIYTCQHVLKMSSSSASASDKHWHHSQTAGLTTCILQGSVATVLKWGSQN